ncbi:MAG TPA: CarD family transcriptional regulator, partial [Rhodanobacteraceae bacterium]
MKPIIQPPLPTSIKQRRYWTAPHGSSLALALADTGRAHAGLVVAVTRDTHSAHALEAELAVFGGGDLDVLHFPDWETLPYDLFAPHPDIVSQRVATLYRLPSVERGVLVVPVATLMQRLAPKSYIAGSGLVLSIGQKLDLAAEQRRLETSGYRHVPQVGEPGDFAVRGALIDIFPMGSPVPYRIELFDEEIDSIRTFDPETQRSDAKVDAVRLLPAREFPLTDESTKSFRNTLRERFPIDPRHCPLYQDIREGVTPAGIEYYLPMFFDHTDTLFDYLAGNALFVLGEGALDAAEHFWSQANERYEQRAHDVERPVLPVAELYLPPQQLRERLNAQLRADVVAKGTNEHAVDLGTQPAPTLPINRKNEVPADDLKRFLAAYPGRVLIAADSAGRREALLELLAIAHLVPTVVPSWSEFVAAGSRVGGNELQSLAERFAITVAVLEQGFALTDPAIVVLTERELLGERAQQSRRRKRAARDPETIIRDLGELAIGAPIVHIDHGVGRYQGLLKLDIGGQGGEFLAIEYAKGDKLYVPVSQLHLVGRYTGAAPELAPLHSLGGDAWERAKRKAAQKVRDVAAELLAIYAQREARQGTAMPVDMPMTEQFATTFPFEETPDQEQAIAAVIADLS